MDQTPYYMSGGGVPSQHQMMGGNPGYPLQMLVPGMPLPPSYQQQPLRLARYPGEALHGGPPPPPPQGMRMPPQYAGMPMQPPMAAYARAGPPMLGRPLMQGPPPGMALQQQHHHQQLQQQQQMQYQYGIPLQLQQFQQQQMLAPPRGSMGGPPGMAPPYMTGGAGPVSMYGGGPMHQQQQQQPSVQLLQPMQGPYRSTATALGAATPKRQAGSGATTPTHPMQRTLSGTHLAATPFQPAQLMPAPPGIVLPDTLSPGSPSALRPSAPSSYVQSATQLAGLHARQGSHGSMGGGFMEPLSPTKLGASRAGSAGSSVRGSLDVSLARGASKGGPSSPGSRTGSAGRRTGSTGAHLGASQELDQHDNIKVAVRLRPPNPQELARGDSQALFVHPSDCRQVQLVVPAPRGGGGAATRSFAFHACLGPTSGQQDVMRLCGITQLLDAALDGYNATILAYGQTGSGKTYTMSGREDALQDGGFLGDGGDDGIITRSILHLFQQAARRSGGCAYSLRASYCEIYNEAVYDLIAFDGRQLAVRWEPQRGFHVPELTTVQCGTLEEMLEVISRGMRHRRVGSHELNLESSRSHSILTVYVDCTPTRPEDHEYGATRYGKVSFVDLAGSERLRDSRSAGSTLRETTNINRSLFMLGKVIAALAEGAQGALVPYRESKLTKLLMDSLGGSALSLMIACCSPSAAHLEETLSTLSYAARAKNIRNVPVVQVDPDQSALAALRREVKLLRTENTYLREQLFQASLPRGAPAPSAGGSRLPSSHGIPPGTPSGGLAAVQQPLQHSTAGRAASALVTGSPGANAEPTDEGPAGATGGSSASASLPHEPGEEEGTSGASTSAGSATPGAASGTGLRPEDMMRRLLDTQRMLVTFSRENEKLSGENDRLRTSRKLVANDYRGALEEVDWLRIKLERLENALLAGSLDSGLLAALDASGMGEGAPEDGSTEAALGEGTAPTPDSAVLQAAQAAMQGVGGEAGSPAQSNSLPSAAAAAVAAGAGSALDSLPAGQPAANVLDATTGAKLGRSMENEPIGMGGSLAAAQELPEWPQPIVGEGGQGESRELGSGRRLIEQYLVANPSELAASPAGGVAASARMGTAASEQVELLLGMQAPTDPAPADELQQPYTAEMPGEPVAAEELQQPSEVQPKSETAGEVQPAATPPQPQADAAHEMPAFATSAPSDAVAAGASAAGMVALAAAAAALPATTEEPQPAASEGVADAASQHTNQNAPADAPQLALESSAAGVTATVLVVGQGSPSISKTGVVVEPELIAKASPAAG